MQNEELNKVTAQKCTELTDSILLKLSLDVHKCAQMNGYTDFNLIMNVLTGCMVRMMTILDDPIREPFISMTLNNLAVNLEYLRKQGK